MSCWLMFFPFSLVYLNGLLKAYLDLSKRALPKSNVVVCIQVDYLELLRSENSLRIKYFRAIFKTAQLL